MQTHNSKAYISSATTTQVYTGPCALVRLVVTETAAGTITVYDEAAGGSTNVVAVLKASIAEGTYDFNVGCSKGLQVVTAGASKVTVVYN